LQYRTIDAELLLFTDETNAQFTGLPVGGTGSWMVTYIRQAFLNS